MSATQQTLAQLVRSKYPDSYKDMSDTDLEAAVIKKYPQYSDLPRTAQVMPNQSTIGPDTRGLLQRANDWWTSKPAYEGTLDSPGRSPQEKMQAVEQGLAVASLPILGTSLAAAPLATTLGVAGGAGGGMAGGYLGKRAGGMVDAPELGEDVGSLTGGILGAYGGAGSAKILGNKAAAIMRNPATPAQAQLGRPGSVKPILPSMLQKYTIPDWLMEKITPTGELGTPTNPGQYMRIPLRAPQGAGDPFNPTSIVQVSRTPFPKPFRPLIGTPEEWAAYEQQMNILRPEASDAGTYHAARGSTAKRTNLQQRLGERILKP